MWLCQKNRCDALLSYRSKPDIKMEPSSGRPVDYQVRKLLPIILLVQVFSFSSMCWWVTDQCLLNTIMLLYLHRHGLVLARHIKNQSLCQFIIYVRSVWQWLKPGSWWGWTWIQWSVWRLEKIRSTLQWKNQPTAHTTMKSVIATFLFTFISVWGKSSLCLSQWTFFSFQYFVFDFHVPPDVMFDKILKLSVSCCNSVT